VTNIALLFATFPEVAEHIQGLSIMGGAIGEGFTDTRCNYPGSTLGLCKKSISHGQNGILIGDGCSSGPTFPEVAEHIQGLSIMGGAIGEGFTDAPMSRLPGEYPWAVQEEHLSWPKWHSYR
jgi:hypothetical protein